MASAHKMVDNVRRGCIAASAAEPFAAGQTLDYTRGRVNPAVCTRVRGKLCVVFRLDGPKSIFFTVVAVATGRSADGHAGQTESVIYGVFVIVVASRLEVVNGGGLDGGGGIVKMVSFKRRLGCSLHD